MSPEIDQFPVKSLPHRYNINRSVVYTRLEKLNIKPQKEKNQSFISGEDLKLLDQLDQHLKAGGNTTDFLDQTTSPTLQPDRQSKISDSRIETTGQDTPDKQDSTTGQLAIQGILDQLVTTALEATENKRKGLNDLRDLEEIASNNWLLPTGRLAEIIGKSNSFFSGKEEINYCGFILKREGKQGNQYMWRVNKTK